jgi:hypothetical protein
MDLLQWWNLIFLLPAVAALLYLLLLAIGAIPMEGYDGDIHAHVDTDIDVHADAHLDFHPDAAHAAHAAGEPFLGALSLIGVGRVPLSLVLMSVCFLWGFFGWAGNQVFRSLLGSPALFIWPSLALALVGSTALTRVLAGGLGRLLPAKESYGASARELVGRIASVRYPLSESRGSVQLYDAFGALHDVPARVLPGEAAIPAGERVILWRFDEREGAYFAIQDDAIDGFADSDPRQFRASARSLGKGGSS